MEAARTGERSRRRVWTRPLLLLFALVVGGAAMAITSSTNAMPVCTKTWNAPAGGAWNDAASWTPAGVPAGTDHACMPDLGAPYTVFISGGDSVDGITVEPDVTFEVRGTASNSTLTVNGETVIDGTLRLTSTGSGWSWFNIGVGVLVTNNGTVEVSGATGGRFFYGGNVTNNGSFVVDTNLSTTGSAGTFVNNGDITLGSGATWTSSTYDLEFLDGTVSGDGEITSSRPMTWTDADITASVVSTASQLTIDGSGSGTIVTRGGGTMSGTIAATKTVVVQGTASSSTRTLSAPLVNAGTVRLETTGSGWSWVNVSTESFTNQASGTVQIGPSSGSGDHFFYGGTFTNEGTVLIRDELSSTGGVGTFVNTGTVDVSAAGSWINNTYDLEQLSGTIAGSGSVTVARPLTWTGGTISADLVSTGALTVGGTAAGTVRAQGGSTLAGTISAGVEVILEGTASNSTRTVPTSLTIDGTLTLRTIGAGWSWFNAPGATVVNNGTVQVGPSAGTGTHFFYGGDITNNGTFRVSDDLSSTGGSGTFTNNGTIELTDDATWSAATYQLDLDTGLVTGDGLIVASRPISWTGGTVDAGVAFDASSTSVTLSGIGSGTMTFRGGGQLSGTIGAGQTVVVQGTASNTTATVNAPLAIDGTLALETTGGGWAWVNAPSQPVVNNGTVRVGPSSGVGEHFFYGGDVTNNGLWDVDSDLDSTGSAGTFTNNGTVDVASGVLWTNNIYVFEQANGEIAGDGEVFIQRPTTWSGGDISANVIVNSSTLSLSGAGNGDITIRSGSQLSGTIGSGQTVVLQGTASNSTATVPTALTVNGDLVLETTGAGWSWLNVGGGASVVNNGTVRVGPSTGTGTHFFYGGDVTNNGLWDVDSDLDSTGSAGTFTNNGTVDVASGALWTNNTYVFEQTAGETTGDGRVLIQRSTTWSGGDITADVTVNGASLAVSGGGAGEIALTGGAQLSGTIGAAKTVVLRGSASNSTATVPTSLTVNGDLVLETTGAGWSWLNVGGGASVVNNGTVRVGPSTGTGTHFFYGGTVTNNGLWDVNTDLSTTGSSGTFTNTGTVDVAAGEVWTVNTYDIISNGGSGIGGGQIASARPISGSGSYLEALTATSNDIDPDRVLSFGSAAFNAATDIFITIDALGSDLLDINGPATLAGEVIVDFGTYVPTACDTWTVVEWDSAVGSFGTVTILPSTTIGPVDITFSQEPNGLVIAAEEAGGGGVCVPNTPPDAVDDAAATPFATPVIVDVVANDSDAEGDPFSVIAVSVPANGTAVDNGDGTITYTPNLGFSGPDTFTYTIEDAPGDTDVAVVTVTVAPNADPIAAPDAAGTDFETAVVVDVLGNDSDPDGDPISVVSVSVPVNGTAVDNGDGTITYTPNPGFSGPDSFTYTIEDSFGAADTASVSISVTPPNAPPAAVNDVANTAFETAVVVDVLGNDSDPDGDPISVVSVSVPVNGTAVDNGDGTITYTPNPGFSGPDSFTYTIEDTAGASDAATVNITVAAPPPNNPPIAVDDAAATAFETAIIIDVVANDSDPDGDAFSIVLVSDPASGVVLDNGDGTITYTPNPGFSGPDSFTYTIEDTSGAAAIATVSVTVAAAPPVNTPPVAVDDAVATVVDTAITTNVLANDSDPDGDPISVTVVGAATNGAVVDNGGGSLTYTPNPGFSGADSFTYTIADPDGATDSATVSVTVAAVPVNNPPVAVADAAATAFETAVTVDVLANDLDPDGDPISVTVVGTATSGTLVDNGDGTITYTPNPGFSGADSFTYTIADSGGATAAASVSVTVAPAPPVNTPPVAVADAAATAFETAVTVDVLANDSDPDGDPISVTVVGLAANGTVVDNGGGSLTYTPNAGFSGPDSYTYTIEDPDGAVAGATVTVTVAAPPPANTPPVAADDATATAFDTAVTVDVLANDSDPDGDPISVTVVGLAANGTVVDNGGGSLTYTPDPGFFGVDSFSYTIEDPDGAASAATVTVTVAPAPPANAAPVATADAGSTEIDTAITIDVLANDLDPDGDPLVISAITAPANGTVVDNGGGQLVYTPAAGFVGVDSFDYLIEDPSGETSVATVTITVVAISAPPSTIPPTTTTTTTVPPTTTTTTTVPPTTTTTTTVPPTTTSTPSNAAVGGVSNTPPSPTSDEGAIQAGDSLTIEVIGNDSDADGDALTLVSVGDAANGTVIVNVDGTVSYTPDPGFAGTDSFEYTVVDANGATATGTVVVTVVAPPADEPEPETDPAAEADESAPDEPAPATEVLGEVEVALAGIFAGESVVLELAAGACSGDVQLIVDGEPAGTVSGDTGVVEVPTVGLPIGLHEASATCLETGDVVAVSTFNTVRQQAAGASGSARNVAALALSSIFLLIGMSLFVTESHTRTS